MSPPRGWPGPIGAEGLVRGGASWGEGLQVTGWLDPLPGQTLSGGGNLIISLLLYKDFISFQPTCEVNIFPILFIYYLFIYFPPIYK